MNKLFKHVLLLSLLICFSEKSLLAQDPEKANKRALQKSSRIYKRDDEADRKAAYSRAKKNNWTTFKELADGRIISLQGLDDAGQPLYLTTYNNTSAAGTTRTNSLYNNGGLGLALSGSSSYLSGRVGMWDGGSIYASHQEFLGGRILNKNTTASISSHSTHVAGTIMASGINPVARGMAFGLPQLIGYDFNNDDSEMAAEAANMLVSNHSYGFIAGWYYNSSPSGGGAARWEWYGAADASEDYKFGFYDNDAKKWDDICYLSEYYLPVKSAGNDRGVSGPGIGQSYYRMNAQGTWTKYTLQAGDINDQSGYDLISLTGNAKNVLTVGAIYGLPNGPYIADNIRITDFSSTGPTDDGRIKPDVVGMGYDVTSTTSTGPAAYVSQNGTSMASPNVSGSLILLQEAYKEKTGVFMRSATLKGLAIHTAEDAGNPGPDYIYGWGLLNMEKAAKCILNNGSQTQIIESELLQGNSKTYSLVASGSGNLMATICWTDPAGQVNTAKTLDETSSKLINDLDIRISGEGSNYQPWILDPAAPGSNATKGDNVRDNVEQIVINNVIPGRTYTLTVSHKGLTLSGTKQKFSLLLSGVGGTAYCTSGASNTADSKITSFSLNNINYTAATGVCTSYTDKTDETIELEAGRSYPLSLQAGTCGTNFNKAAKVYIDFNADGDFNDTGEEVATSSVISAAGGSNSNILIPKTVSIDGYSLLRIVLTETNTISTINSCGSYAKGETIDYRVKFLRLSNDVGIGAIIAPITGNCYNTAQKVTVKIKNYGNNSITNIPVTVVVKKGATTVATLSETFFCPIKSLDEVVFTLNGTFNAEPGSTYQIIANTGLSIDLDNSNDEKTASLTFNTPAVLSSASAVLCENSGAYNLSNTGEGNVFWYLNKTDALPIASSSLATPGNYATSASINTLYAGVNDFSGKAGPATNTVFSSGGYLGGNNPSVLMSTQVPVILESARLYINSPGRITFVVSKTGVGTEVSRVTLDVCPPGKVYPLNLLLPEAGNYTVSISYEGGATIYRNNGGVTGYPFKIGDFFSITGNTATDPTGVNSNYYKGFYYYFYDLAVKSPGCSSLDRVAVNTSSLNTPNISVNGNILSSSAGTGNQWYLNGTAIPGATAANYTATQAGSYGVKVLSGSCLVTSPSVLVGISLPLPANNFTVSTLSETCKTQDNGEINITALNALNYTASLEYNGITNNYSFVNSLSIKNLAAGTYKLCLSVEGYSSYKICYDLVVGEPKDLSVYTQINLVTNTVNLNLQGSNSYQIDLNGENFKTNSESIALPLKNGSNYIKISTDKACQGIIEKTIYVSDKALVFPNPFEDDLNITLGNNESANTWVSIVDNTGQVVYNQAKTSINGNIQLHLASLKSGVYFLKLNTENAETIYKILKR
ncbi:MAG: S8/S53 family peptidase [Sphingobacteriaceae bacterium]